MSIFGSQTTAEHIPTELSSNTEKILIPRIDYTFKNVLSMIYLIKYD